MPSHTIHYGHIADGDETVDEVLMMVMHGPRTFTGEDTVEINCHGGTYVVSRVLETVLKAGARPAEPGEFTKRAFLNGKMDLSQAEAVIDVITSENEYALQSSISQLKGSVKNRIKEIREKIIYHTAFIETALDDPEHISVDGYGEVLKEAAEEVIDKLKELIDSSDDGRIMKEGIQTVILGKPNAGKSSLLNILRVMTVRLLQILKERQRCLRGADPSAGTDFEYYRHCRNPSDRRYCGKNGCR